ERYGAMASGDEAEVLQTLTTSASNLLGSDGLVLDAGAYPHSQYVGYANALDVSQVPPRPSRVKWVALSAVGILLAVVSLVVFFQGGGGIGGSWGAQDGAGLPPVTQPPKVAVPDSPAPAQKLA